MKTTSRRGLQYWDNESQSGSEIALIDARTGELNRVGLLDAARVFRGCANILRYLAEQCDAMSIRTRLIADGETSEVYTVDTDKKENAA